jgi:hypothetical protein
VINTLATSLSVGNLIAHPRALKFQGISNVFTDQQKPETLLVNCETQESETLCITFGNV